MQLKQFESGENIHDPLFREKLNALVAAVNELQGGGGGGSGFIPPEFTQSRVEYGIPVRITDFGATGPGYYQFTEVEDIASGSADWSDKASGLTHTELGEARGIGGWSDEWFNYPIIGRVVFLRPSVSLDSSGDRIFEFNIPAPLFFPVSMSQTGGSEGTYTSQCSYTYTVTDADSVSLGTGVNPTSSPHTYKRPSNGPMNAATEGVAYWADNAGSPELRIVHCNESLNFTFEEC